MKLLVVGFLTFLLITPSPVYAQNEQAPSDVTVKFFQLVSRGEIDAAERLTNGRLLIVNGDMFGPRYKLSIREPLKDFQTSGLELVEVVSTEVDGDYAKVSAHFLRKDGRSAVDMYRIYLVRDESWTVLGWEKLSWDVRVWPDKRFVEPQGVPIKIDCPKCG